MSRQLAFERTCPDCGETFTSNYRTPGLGTHRGSKDCVARTRVRRHREAQTGELPRVWRWVLRGVVDVEPEEHATVVTVPDWVAEVVGAAHQLQGKVVNPLVLMDMAADAAVPFIVACKKDRQLIEAFRAAVKLGGVRAGATFMGDHQSFIKAFCGSCP